MRSSNSSARERIDAILIWQTFTVIAPVLIISAIGYAWLKKGQPFDTDSIGGLVMNIGSPCLIFSSITTINVDPAAFAQVAGISALAILTMSIVGFILLRACQLPVAAYLPTLVQPNAGNMGLPLTFMAFGETGIALGVAYFFVTAIAQYTLGLGIASGTFNLVQLARQPVVWAVVLALGVQYTDAPVPAFIAATVELVAGFVIPAMLLMLGASIARLQLTNLRTTLAISALRLGGGLALGCLFIWMFDLQGVVAGVVLIQSAMPSAVFNIVFAERFDNEPEAVAAVILASTLASFAILPIVVGIALQL